MIVGISIMQVLLAVLTFLLVVKLELDQNKRHIAVSEELERLAKELGEQVEIIERLEAAVDLRREQHVAPTPA